MARVVMSVAWRRGLRFGSGLAVVGALLWKFFPGEMTSQFDRSMWLAALAIQPVALTGLVIHAARLGILAGLPAGRLGRPLAALLLSQGLNLLLPGRIAELLKASYLHAHADVPLARGFAAIFMERSVDLIIVAILSMVGVLLVSTGTAYWAIAVAVCLGFGLYLLPGQEKRLSGLVGRLPWPAAAAFGVRFLQHVSSTVRDRVFMVAMGLGVLTWLTSIFNVYLFVWIAGKHPVDLTGTISLFVATTIGGAIPGLPGGFGPYEAGAAIALRSYGYSIGEALALGLVMHLAQFVIPLIGAGVILAREPIGVWRLVTDALGRSGGKSAGGQ